MSGHSRWSTIKRKKGAVDAKRGKVFTKLIREIGTAARIGGGDANSNPRLRLAVDKARGANMTKDTIERAIKRGVGGDDGAAFEEVVYEGYGPGGAAIYVEALTDNKNRTVGEVRHVLTKHGGNLGASGCVAYLFEKKGIALFDAASVDLDALMEAALEAGADDVVEAGSSIEVVTGPGSLNSVVSELAAKGFEPAESSITMEASTKVSLAGAHAESMLRVADALEDLDDVQNVYANFDISDEEMQRIAG
jgi:YebC/PmpR family DNA-binding regulatory protein